jgi:hypothetical protein
MARSTGILSLGIRRDATTWENGCKGLGFDTPNPIKKGSPTLSELRAFFKSKPEWIFLAGHFGDLELSNEDGSVTATFDTDGVRLAVSGATALLKKGSEDFSLDANCKVVLWGGCSVCSREMTIRTMRTLFGPHVLLGFMGTTSWEMVDAMLGGGFIRAGNHFFDRVAGKDDNAAGVRDAWMETAKSGYGETKAEPKFRAIDPDGREWKLQKGEIRPGRSFV